MQEIINRYIGKLPLQGNAGLDLVGFPHSHKAAFEQVATNEQCVIMSREVGSVCTGLIEEGYDSKGFRIHAKSCDWGPMAGFVCRKPEFNKKGIEGVAYNTREHEHALNDTDNAGWKASTVQICISDERLNWLVNKKNPAINARKKSQYYWEGTDSKTTVGGTVTIQYILRREKREKDDVWALYEKTNRFKPVYAMALGVNNEDIGLEPVMAMVNPYPAWPKGHYKNAVTGDYDLFAIWPTVGQFARGLKSGEDRRIAGMGPSQMEWVQKEGERVLKDQSNKIIIKYEDPQMGNISNRVHMVAQMLNSVIGIMGGKFVNRHMVHHSDEGGRPFVDEIDKPLIGFVPVQGRVLTIGLPDIPEIQNFTAMCAALGFRIFLNKGWADRLGIYGFTGGWDEGWRKGYTWTNR